MPEAIFGIFASICVMLVFTVGICDQGWPSLITINKYYYYNSSEDDEEDED